MDINQTCSLVLKDVNQYDISSCHYRILDRLGYDVSKIEKDDKLKRNTQIGLMMKHNPRLTSVIRNITTSTIESYISLNQIKEEDIIVKAYDGFITPKKLNVTTSQFIPLDLQKVFEVLIISSDRKKYLGLSNNKCTIKGIPYRYPEIDQFLCRIIKINFANQEVIFKTLQKIKDDVLNSTKSRLFCIPSGKGQYNVFLKVYGETTIGEGLVDILDTEDINKERYYDFYLRPFVESILIEFL